MTALKATEQASLLGTFVPPGVIMPFAGATAPSGWLLCNGSAISTTTYASLYAAISTAWGNPGGGTFNLPDLRGRFLRGRNINGSVVNEPVADAAARTACNSGGNTAENVGSVQTQATKKNGLATNGHQHDFIGDVDHGIMTTNSGSQANTCVVSLSGMNTGSYNSNGHIKTEAITVALTDGDNETRANNAYVNYIIKY